MKIQKLIKNSKDIYIDMKIGLKILNYTLIVKL